MKTIMLYGFLGKDFGKVHRYEVANVAEAVRAMSTTLNGFKQAIIDGGSYHIIAGGYKDEGDLINPMSDRETIRLVPAVAGSGKIGKIILGAALIGLSFSSFGATSFLSGTAFSFTAGSIMRSVGVSMILGGISEILFPPPKMESLEPVANRPSFMFNGAINTVKQGGAVPICYGRLIVGSQVISAGLSVERVRV